MRSMKPHWSPGKSWLFYWDEEQIWVLLCSDNFTAYGSFATLAESLP